MMLTTFALCVASYVIGLLCMLLVCQKETRKGWEMAKKWEGHYNEKNKDFQETHRKWYNLNQSSTLARIDLEADRDEAKEQFDNLFADLKTLVFEHTPQQNPNKDETDENQGCKDVDPNTVMSRSEYVEFRGQLSRN